MSSDDWPLPCLCLFFLKFFVALNSHSSARARSGRGAGVIGRTGHGGAELPDLPAGGEGTDQIYDGALAILFNTLRALCGPAWLPTEVLFSRRRPGNIQPYRDFFRVPLRFDMEQTALVFPTKWLDHAVPGADPVPRQRIERRIAALASLDHPDLVSQLRRLLRVLLTTHRGSLEQVAQLFSMQGRTLNRRLKARGATFQALVDEGRYEIARQLLEHTHMSMSEIAATLDYAAASAFTRAFRRWSGTTPAAWRARLDAGD